MANYDVIKTYGIEITAVTDKATDQINQLEKELDELSKKKGLSAGLQSQIDKIGESLNGLKGEIVSSTKSINDNLSKINTDKMSQEFKDMQNSIASSVNELQEEMKNLKNSMDFLKTGDFSGFTSGIGKSFDTLSDNISDIVGKFSELSNFINDIRVGAIDTSGLQKSEKGVKTATSHITNDLTKTKTKVEELLRQMRDAMDDFTLDDLMSDGKNSGLGTEEARTLSENIDIILQLIDELKKAQVDVNDIFNKDGIKLSEKALKGYRTELNKIVKERTADAAKERKKSTNPTEVRFRYVIEDPNSSTIDSIVEKVKTDVIEKVQKRIDGSPIRIPIGYTYDKAGITSAKELDKIENQNVDKTIFEHIKLDVKADTSNLVDYVKDQVDEINKQLKDTKRQIEVEVVGKVNNDTVDESLNDLQEEILHRQYNGSGFTTISGANINIGGDNIATETTLSNIRDILLDWNHAKSSSSLSVETLSKEDENALFDYENALKIRKRSSVLLSQTEGQLDVVEYARAKIALLSKQKSDLTSINNNVKKGNIDALQGTDYYSAYYVKDDVKYAKYGSSGETLDKWQEKLNSEFEETHKKIVDATASLNDEFDGYLRGEKDWKELLIEDLKKQWAKDTTDSALEKAKLERADSVKLLMDRHNSNLKPGQERMTSDQAVLQLINSEYSERIKEIQDSNELTEKYESQITSIKRKALNQIIKDLTKGYHDAILLTQNMIKAQERNIALNSDGSEQNSSLRIGTKANRQGQANNPDEAINALNSELDQIDQEAISKHKAQQEITNDLKLQKNIMSEIVDLIEKQKTASLSDKEVINERLNALIQNLTLTKQELQAQENIEDVIKSITDLEEKRSTAIKNLESAKTKLEEDKKSGASTKVLNQSKNEIIKQNGIIAQLDLEIDNYTNQLDETIRNSFSENVDNLETFIKTKLSSIDKLILNSTNKENAIIGQAKRAKYDIASQYTLRDHSKSGYISRDNKISAISEEQSRLSKMVRYNRDGSYDTSAMTKLEEKRYFNNIKILKDLKLQQVVYEAIYGKRAEILGIEEKETETIKETSIALKNLPLSKKGADAYLNTPTIFTSDGTGEKLKGSIFENSNSRIPENLKGLSLESAEQIKNNLSLVISELTDYVGKEILKDSEKVEAKMRDAARKMVQKDIDILQRELTDNNEYIKQLKQNGADSGVIKSAQKRSNELSATINQLKYSEVDNTALKEEIQNLERIKKLQEEISNSGDQNKIMDLAEQRAKSEERIAYLQENFDKASSVRESRIQLYVDLQKKEFELVKSILEKKERELNIVNELVSLKQKEREESEKIRQEEEIALAEKEKRESLTEEEQKSNINKKYNSQIAEQEEVIQKEKEAISPLKQKSEELEYQLKLIKEQAALHYKDLIIREKTLNSLISNPKTSIDKKEDYKKELEKIPQLKEVAAKQTLPSNWNSLAKSTRTKYKSRYLADSEKYQSQFMSISKEYNDAKYNYGDNAEETLAIYNELVSVSEKLLDSSLKYIATGGEESKVAEKILSASKIKYEHDSSSIKTQKSRNDLLLQEHEIALKTAEANKSTLEVKKQEELDAIQTRKEEANLLKEKQQYINALEQEAKLKRKTGFYQGMSDEQYLAAYKVDAMLKLINDDQKVLNSLADNTSDEYIEIANRIEKAKSLLKEFRHEALQIDGLKLSEETGRTYYKKDTKIKGVSYSGLGSTTAKDMSEIRENAKAVTNSILEEHKAQTRVTSEVKETKKEYSELGHLRKFAGYSDEQVGLVEEIFKVNQQLQSNAKLSKEETEELKKQLKVLHEQAKLKDIKINRKGYARYLSGRNDFLDNPSKYDTNSLIHSYLHPQIQSDNIVDNINSNGSEQFALENTLQNIKKILQSGLKVKVVDKLDSYETPSDDASKIGYASRAKKVGATSEYGKNEKGSFNTKGYQEVAKELGLLQKSKNGNLFVSKKDRNKVYSEMDKRGIARYLEEDTNATKKNIEAKKESKKVVDKDTDATKQNSQAKKSNAERERGKDFGDGAKYINSDISVARKQLARKNLGDDTRNKWQSIFDSATAEAEKRGYQKNAQGFYEDQKKKQEVAKKTTKVVEQESKKQEIAKDASAEAIKGALTQAEQLLTFYKSKDTLNEKELADVSQLEEFIRVNKAGLAEIETETKESSSTTVQSEEKKQEAIKETRKEIDYEKASVEELINAYKKSEKALKTSKRQETIDYHNNVLTNSGKSLQDKGYSLADGKWKQTNSLDKLFKDPSLMSERELGVALGSYSNEWIKLYLDGVKASTPEMEQAFKVMAEIPEEILREVLEINSPSKVMEKLGYWTNAGFAKGIRDNSDDIKNALIQAFTDAKITQGELEKWLGLDDTKSLIGKQGNNTIYKAIKDIVSNNSLSNSYKSDNIIGLSKAKEMVKSSGLKVNDDDLKSLGKKVGRQWQIAEDAVNEYIIKKKEALSKEKEAQNEAIKYLDRQSDKYKAVIDLAEKLGLVLGNNVNITEKVKDGIPSYSLKGELASANISLGEDGSWKVSSVKEINDGYSKLKKTLSEISKLKGYKIDLLDESDPAMFGTYADKVKEAKDALVALRLVEENGYNGEPIEDLVQKLELVKRVSSELKGSLQVGESESIGKIDTSRLNQVRQQLEALAFSTSKGSVEIKKMSKNNTELTYTVRTADNMLQTYTITMNKYTGALTKTLVSEEKHLSGFQKALKGIGAKFQEIFRYTIASVSIYEVFNFIKQGVNVVKEMDAAMTELRKVSNDTEAALQSFRKEAFEIANTIGSTGKEIVNSAADWERLGYSIHEASELARNSALYANVGDMEIDVATEHMVSTLKAFNIEAKDSIRIVDKFNEIGNSYAITSSGIGEALERSASSLVAAGNDIDKSIALITAGNIVSQDPESVGNAIKVLSLRVRGSKTELEEMGEETDNLASSTSKLRSEILDLTGVDLMLDDNTYKDTYTILLEISKVWDQLSDVSQANVLEKLAGKTRASVVAGLLQQGETLEQVYKDSQNAAGSAEEENKKYMDSIQGHLDVLTNKWQQMWDSGINADFVNFFIDLGAGVLDVVNNIGLLKSSFLALGTVFTGKEIFKAFKGEGRVKMFTLSKYAFEEFNGDVYELCIA